jgi:hypothetical protein
MQIPIPVPYLDTLNLDIDSVLIAIVIISLFKQ